jgi:hypothetical protein
MSVSADTFASLQQVEGAGEASRIPVALPLRSPAGADYVGVYGENTSAGSSSSNQFLTSITRSDHSRSVSAPPVQDNQQTSEGQETCSVDLPSPPTDVIIPPDDVPTGEPLDDSQLPALKNSYLGWVNLGLETADRTGNHFSALALPGPGSARSRLARRFCGKCGEPATGQFVHALGHTYHLDCFTCQVGASALNTSE